MRISTGDRLKQIMKERNLKQVDILKLAAKHSQEGVKISKTDLSQYVNGKTEPRQDKLYILSEALNVSEAWLMGYDTDKERIPNDKRENKDDQIKTLAAHHEGDEWTEEELDELEKFKEYLRSRREK
ncbi:helix-turn-helix domain-containing protein [Virgibacillus salexigens]|uniref:HTH cro/C1-type domain-containing protein n=1 Tax=Virgibacillus kapii TaxID=1638645 RepID=A0ABQ2DKP3_9BACI|nr:helix-turn-helix domain-containing protein [Virgibacillus kapii]GGJ61738.1 hypothetical protein GCM10007111_24820 [Virgibacillus kapii]